VVIAPAIGGTWLGAGTGLIASTGTAPTPKDFTRT
jgi:hypothetical protein